MDALSLLQLAFLRRKRTLPDGHPEPMALNRALGSPLSGVAQGMRNTGPWLRTTAHSTCPQTPKAALFVPCVLPNFGVLYSFMMRPTSCCIGL